MRRSTIGLAALALCLPLLGGAAAAESVGPDELSDYPEPTVTGTQIADGVARFSEGNPLRITATPVQLQAHEQLAVEARSLGYEVETRTYDGVLTALTATKRGTDKADEQIVFGAHLDSMVSTVNGAYDNATGSRTVMELARSFATVDTHRTLVFAWFNGEEEGALGSNRFAKDLKASGTNVSAYLGFDMVGVAWPVGVTATDKNCLCMWRGQRDADLDDVLRQVNYDFLGFPEGRTEVSIEGTNVRNSDERSFANQGFRTLRWAGLRKAADYPEYHLPRDNMATIDATAGGREFFEKGLHNTLRSAYYTAAALDLEDIPAPAAVEVAEADMVRNDTRTHAPGDSHTH